MLPGLTKEQNEYLEALHIKAIVDAIEFYRKHGKTRNRRYFEKGEEELAKAKAYLELGNFDSNARLCEM